MKDCRCLFCRIISGEIPSTGVYEDEHVYAFRDINPQAPVHVIVTPKEHIANAMELEGEKALAAAHCFAAIREIAKTEGLENGFRVINNCGEDGGQTVMHLHFHLLGGKKLGEKIL